ncbi:hypothetical protein B0J14DRAFT_694889 [Halenospora varia]|nr:hypothetical protein B0J14DRAFT_694889 [Halenospora varia]
MKFSQAIKSVVLAVSVLSASVTACVTANPTPTAFTDFNNNIVFYPQSNAVLWKTLYARTLQLPDESLLMTWENYPAEPPLDTQNGWGMRFQPFLYTLPQAIGGYAAGSILAAGVSAPYSLVGGVYIELYISTDGALTWSFLSHIAYAAGPEDITNGHSALWEPFLMMYNGQIVCYYSDQSDPLHAQKLAHKTTSDLLTWSTAVNDVAYSTYGARPGMTTVAHIESTNKYILTYEYCGNSCQVFYKVSANPLNFNAVAGVGLTGNNTAATKAYGSPYVIWTENPNKSDGSGVIIVSASSSEYLWINEDSADTAGWKLVNVGQWSAYSRSLRIITRNGAKKLLFGNGGNIGDLVCNSVANGVIEVPY